MSSQRERQRERERNQRQLTVPSLSSNGNSTLFSEPIRQKHDDETSKRIKNTLGDFDQVQKFMINDPKPLLGISTREITRIKGSNAKLQQIFSEMKNTLEPITALDDLFDDNDANACNGEPMLNNNSNTTIINNNISISSNTNTLYANNGNNNSLSNTNLNEIQARIIQITERNNHSNYINDRSLDDVSDDDHFKPIPPKTSRRKSSSKTDAEIGNKTIANNINTINNTNNGNIKNSSTSSESSGSSSSNSSSSSESSEDDDDEEEEKVSDDIKKEECNEKDAPKLSSHSQQPEIAEWNLETFMDKKTTTTTTTTSTTLQSSSATIKSNCADSVADVIDRVAKGELGEEYDWSDDSLSLSPKKRKSAHQPQFEPKRKEQSKQQSKHDQPSTPSTPQQQPPPAAPPPQHKPSKNQPNKSPDHIIQDHSNQQQNRQNINELKSQQKLSTSPQLAKSLIVSIKLMLLKRIPGSVYSNNCGGNPLSSSCSSSGSSSSSSSSGSTNGDAINATVNDDNIKPIKRKASQNNIKLEKNKSIKLEPDVNNKKPRDLVKSITKSKISSSKSSSQPPQESRITTAEHISSSDHLLCDPLLSVPVKLEPHSPQNHLLSMQMTPTQPTLTPPFNLPPPPTLIAASIGQNITSSINLRTPPEIAGTSLGQAPDDYLSSAKKLKHAADREPDRTAQACKYLEAVLFFILTGNAMENRSAQNEMEKVCVMFRETLNLLRVCTGKFTKSRSSHQANVPTTDYKLTTLSYRCQSLLSLKLSRLKSKEIRDNNKLIQQQNQELALNGNTGGSAVALVSVQQRQIALLQQYHHAHDTWQQADHLIDKHPSCKAFFDALDNECGTLSLNSTFDHLVHYVKTGLQILK